MKPHIDWQVLPHGPLERLADNLYTVVGQLAMPLGESTRRMTIVRLSGERLAVYSAIALDEGEMRRVEALGRPAFLIVPNAMHRLDVRAWKDRYPAMQVIAPEAALDAVGEVVPVDTTSTQLGDPRVRLGPVPGTDYRELALLVDTGTGGRTLVVNDLIFNLPPIEGLAGFALRLLGFAPGRPAMPKLVTRRLVADEAALRAQLLAWADLPGLERVLVSHGGPIEQPRAVLLALAEGRAR